MEVWAALGGALIGALVGGLVTLLVQRRVQTRTQRARIYDDLLPELTNMIDRGKSARPGFRDRLAPIVRAGHVVGGEDSRRVDDLALRYDAWEIMHRKHTVSDGMGGSKLNLGEVDEAEYRQLSDDFWMAVEKYEHWLRVELDKRI